MRDLLILMLDGDRLLSFRRRLLCAVAVFSLLTATAAIALLLLSRSNPWLVGVKNEPHWSWAIGSGRLKTWFAEPGVPQEYEWWTNSWYRGLDGQPIIWGFTLHRGSTGGVIVLAIPLWFFTGIFGLLAFLSFGSHESRDHEPAN